MNEENRSYETKGVKILLSGTVCDEDTVLTVSSVKNLPAVLGEYAVTAYDFQLEGVNELSGTAEINIPLSLNEGEYPAAAYYNEDTGEWDPVASEYADGYVKITADHFSTYGVFTVTRANTRAAALKYSCLPYSTKNLDACVEALVNSAQGGSPTAECADIATGYISDVMFWGLDIGNTLMETAGLSSEFIDAHSDKLGYLGLAIAAYQATRTAYNDEQSKGVGIAMKAAGQWVFGKAAGLLKSSVMSASMFSIAFVDYTINKFAEEAISGREDIYKEAFNLYYQRGEDGYRSAKEWFDLLYPLFQNENLSESELKSSVDNVVTQYCNQFWQDESVVAYYFDQATKMGWSGGGGLNSRIQRELSAELRSTLYNGTLVSVFRSISMKIANENDAQLRKQLDEYTRLMNQVVTLSFYDSSLAKTSDYKDCKVSFKKVPARIIDKEKWQCQLDEKGNGQIQFRVFAYLDAGFQPTLTITDKDSSKRELKILIDVPETKIDVAKKEEKINYSGTYTGILNVTETGKEIDVTTEVTYERDFGDGAYYKIVCSNNETGSTYINNSYFVRSTGEANIAGARFNFSQDGQSFSATMLDFNKKAWGIINAEKR
ncbi:MAG: hypothetical protein PHG06_11355 [Parabacteroides sp.]|nr:hypothetical protein [Parabacteroides sp.]